MKTLRINLVFLLLMLAPGLSFAVDESEFEDLPEPPVLPEQVESGEPIEPEVTIIRRDDAVIEEYRINGNLYKVKVTPVVGKPYFLVDQNGNGQLTRVDTLYENTGVPQWVLFSW